MFSHKKVVFAILCLLTALRVSAYPVSIAKLSNPDTNQTIILMGDTHLASDHLNQDLYNDDDFIAMFYEYANNNDTAIIIEPLIDIDNCDWQALTKEDVQNSNILCKECQDSTLKKLFKLHNNYSYNLNKTLVKLQSFMNENRVEVSRNLEAALDTFEQKIDLSPFFPELLSTVTPESIKKMAQEALNEISATAAYFTIETSALEGLLTNLIRMAEHETRSYRPYSFDICNDNDHYLKRCNDHDFSFFVKNLATNYEQQIHFFTQDFLLDIFETKLLNAIHHNSSPKLLLFLGNKHAITLGNVLKNNGWKEEYFLGQSSEDIKQLHEDIQQVFDPSATKEELRAKAKEHTKEHSKPVSLDNLRAIFETN